MQPMQPNQTLRDWGASVVRTLTALGVGAFLTWLTGRWGWTVDNNTAVGVVSSTTAFIAGLYHASVRALEMKFPKAGWLLGFARPPKYPTSTPPAPAG
jgi:hypothetical protein